MKTTTKAVLLLPIFFFLFTSIYAQGELIAKPASFFDILFNPQAITLNSATYAPDAQIIGTLATPVDGLKCTSGKTIDKLVFSIKNSAGTEVWSGYAPVSVPCSTISFLVTHNPTYGDASTGSQTWKFSFIPSTLPEGSYTIDAYVRAGATDVTQYATYAGEQQMNPNKSGFYIVKGAATQPSNAIPQPSPYCTTNCGQCVAGVQTCRSSTCATYAHACSCEVSTTDKCPDTKFTKNADCTYTYLECPAVTQPQNETYDVPVSSSYNWIYAVVAIIIIGVVIWMLKK